MSYAVSDKIYFGQYTFSITVDTEQCQPISNYTKFIDPLVECRLKNDWRNYRVIVYTSDISFVDWIVENYPILKLSCPLNQNHLDILTNVGLEDNQIFRKQPFYGKYYFKLDAWVPWTKRDELDASRVREIQSFMHDMKDTKMTHDAQSRYTMSYPSHNHAMTIQNGSLYTIPSTRWSYYPSFPKIYTNDESSLMLFKLMFSDCLTIKISKVITL